jgi:putative aminopeptidase FrvX
MIGAKKSQVLRKGNHPANKMSIPSIDTSFLLDFLTGLLNTPSPTGFTDQAIAFTEKHLSGISGLSLARNRKGALTGDWNGTNSDRPRALTAHVDTLGAVVKEIKSNGRLRMSQLGGYVWNSVEGEGCTVHTRDGEQVRGSILFHKSSVHVFGKSVSETKREDENMEIRLDIRAASPEEVRKAGIEVGDYVTFDPRIEVVNGFIRSRHLDDKACVACIVAAVKAISSAGLVPVQKTHLLITNYEEVGHGAAAGIPADVTELVTVDMGAVGEGQNSDEFHASICIKDSGGPYHLGLTTKLRDLADRFAIQYRPDVYPFYGSDGESTWRAGGDLAVALIGPGVDASHGYERTHIDALKTTAHWIMAYLLH